MSNIVSNGREQLLKEPETEEQVLEAIARVRKEFESKFAQAGFWKKIWLYWQRDRRIREEIERIAPSHGLYLTTGSKGSQNKITDSDDASASTES